MNIAFDHHGARVARPRRGLRRPRRRSVRTPTARALYRILDGAGADGVETETAPAAKSRGATR